MAGKKKKFNDDNDVVEEQVQIDFVGRSPEEYDTEGITQLLMPLFRSSSVELAELVKLIVENKDVGSVIKQDEPIEEIDEDDDDDDEDNVFGLTTVIDLAKKKDTACINQIQQHFQKLVEEHCTDKMKSNWLSLLADDSKPIGFIINERFINVPPQISVPLFESLSKEIKESKDISNFKHYIMFSKIYKGSKNKKKPSKSKEAIPEMLWSNAEEQIIDEESEMKFEFPINDEVESGVTGSWLEDDEAMASYRRVLLFSAEKLDEIASEIKATFSA